VSAPDRQNAVSWIGLLLVCLCAVLAAILELLLVPVYVGSVVLPVAVVLAVASNIALPRLAFGIFPRALAAAAPFVLWLVVVFVFGVFGRPEGDVILPGGSSVQLVSYGVLLGGALAGTITVVVTVPPRHRPSPTGGTSDPAGPRGVSGGTGRDSPRQGPPAQR
jgi:hypothetical protein